tara:strand:- start:1085 stop:1681 length:597 start_codon:yes stop_codon:yes gene_type:complete
MAFSFTRTGFSGFGDPTDPIKTKKRLGTTSKRVPTPEGYDRVITTTFENKNVTAGGSKPYAGSESFQTAFAAARKQGKSQFEFRGKPYTTELAKPKPSVESISYSKETKTLPGLRFTTDGTNISGSLPTKIKMNNTPPPAPTPKKKKRKKVDLGFIPDALESVGDAFRSLRLFRRGRRNKPFRPFKIRGGANPILRRR